MTESSLPMLLPFIKEWLEENGHDPETCLSSWEIDSQEMMATVKKLFLDCEVLIHQCPENSTAQWVAFEPALVEHAACSVSPEVYSRLTRTEPSSEIQIVLRWKSSASNVLQMPLNLTGRKLENGEFHWRLSDELILGCFLATQVEDHIHQDSKFPCFANPEEVLSAYQHGAVQRTTPIEILNVDQEARYEPSRNVWKIQKVPHRLTTTVGRVLFNSHLTPGAPFINDTMTLRGWQTLLPLLFAELAAGVAMQTIFELQPFATEVLSRSGLSLSMIDWEPQIDKQGLLDSTLKKLKRYERAYERGLIANMERYHKSLELWNSLRHELKQSLWKDLKAKPLSKSTFYECTAQAGLMKEREVAELQGMLGLVKARNHSPWEVAITSSWAEGLSPHEYWMRASQQRHDLVDRLSLSEERQRMRAVMLDALRNDRICMFDCGTTHGIEKKKNFRRWPFSSDFPEIVGRCSCEEVAHPLTGRVLLHRNEVITETKAELLGKLGLAQLRVRSPLQCEAEGGICQRCYGIDFTTGSLIQPGQPVGRIAANVLSTHLQTTRMTYSGDLPFSFQLPPSTAYRSGKVQFENTEYVIDAQGSRRVISLDGRVRLLDRHGRRQTTIALPRDALLLVADGDFVYQGQTLFSWDWHELLFLSRQAGCVRWVDLIEGKTIEPDGDTLQGAWRILPYEAPHRPRLVLQDQQGKVLQTYYLPEGSQVLVAHSQQVLSGAILAKVFRTSRQEETGIDPIQKLLFAERPKHPCQLSPVDGEVVHVDRRGSHYRIEIFSKRSEEYFEVENLPRTQMLHYRVGDLVKAGTPLNYGQIDPHQVLEVLGTQGLCHYLLEKLRFLYYHSEKIAEIHFEIALRKMMSQAEVEDPGDTFLSQGEIGSVHAIQSENRQLAKQVIITDPGESTFVQGEKMARTSFERVVGQLRTCGMRPPSARPARGALARPLLCGLPQFSSFQKGKKP
ncbi:Hypothetical protein PBC10988_29110 [Planctomycetales bacterium 10988]|nr:Hypothetical protein PBC10988_29110 [Planctomycetales bacterium 10988]